MRRSTTRRVLGGVGAMALVAGALLMTSAPAGAVSVADEASLRLQFTDTNVTSITLDANINLVNCGAGALTRNSSNPITITAGLGNTIHQTCAGNDLLDQSGSGDLTFVGLTMIGVANNDIISGGAGTITLLNTILSGIDGGNGISGGNVVMLTNSSISDVNGGDGISTGPSTTLINSSINDVGDGDGISGSGDVTLTNSSINGITDGDGVSASGVVTLTDSSINGSTTGDCDGVSSPGVTMVRSTITGCFDGISTQTASLTNSTVTGANSNGISAAEVTLLFSDVVGNAENISARTLTSTASVVANATDGDSCSVGTTTSNGYNFDDDGTCGFDQTTDQSDAGDPGLGPLAANGGATLTFLPQSGSTLLDKVPPGSCSVATDQRGVTRPQGAACDVGSVEVAVAGPTPEAGPVEVAPTLTG